MSGGEHTAAVTPRIVHLSSRNILVGCAVVAGGIWLLGRWVTMPVGLLATAADSSKLWDLRCEIREKLIAFIQKNHPQSLPKVRAHLEGTNPNRNL